MVTYRDSNARAQHRSAASARRRPHRRVRLAKVDVVHRSCEPHDSNELVYYAVVSSSAQHAPVSSPTSALVPSGIASTHVHGVPTSTTTGASLRGSGG